MAWIGALVLALLAAMSVLSIIGRALSGLGLGPVPGDFELVEAGTALAVFCFLPWAHLKRGHAVVDLLWRAYPAPLRRVLDVASDALMFGAWALLIWRMGVAMLDYRANGEVTFILQFPVWWGYAASMIPGVLGCVVYAWRLLESVGLATPPEGFEPAPAAH
ncbi:MAG: TRAP transporter small permease [Burkholderiaceae bacterium]|nr:TRAP transporter small permease [Burkholderiaceae bacterium]